MRACKDPSARSIYRRRSPRIGFAGKDLQFDSPAWMSIAGFS